MKAPFVVGMQSLKPGDKSHADRDGPETIVDNEILQEIVEKNPGCIVKDCAKELGVSPATISLYLKLIGKVKKIDSSFE